MSSGYNRKNVDWKERDNQRKESQEKLRQLINDEAERTSIRKAAAKRSKEKAEIPVFSECVIGYRRWKIDSAGLLWPITMNIAPWRPGVNKAECPTKRHHAPSKKCECGLYTLRRPPSAEMEWPLETIVGAVVSWGDLQVHPNGHRSEYAQIVAFARPIFGVEIEDWECERLRKALMNLSEFYGVPVVPEHQLQAEALKHGSVLPDDVYPEPELWSENLYYNQHWLHLVKQSQGSKKHRMNKAVNTAIWYASTGPLFSPSPSDPPS
jgi:hypothetical protein